MLQMASLAAEGGGLNYLMAGTFCWVSDPNPAPNPTPNPNPNPSPNSNPNPDPNPNPEPSLNQVTSSTSSRGSSVEIAS